MPRLFASLALLLSISPSALAAPRSVVLIVADDLGRDLGCFGNEAIQTPHLDALAAEGTRFEFAFCTAASCSPSRSVILTGLFNHANGQYGLQHSVHNFTTLAHVKSLPVLLAESGYRTCQIGKMHVQPAESYRFEVTPAALHDAQTRQAGGDRNPVMMAELAKRFIEMSDDRPFFLYFCPTDPHRAAQGFANDRDYPGIEPIRYRPNDVAVPHFLPDRPETRSELAQYYQSVSRLDQGVGRLLDVLTETGHADDTLVLFLSDNGVPFPNAKTNLYDSGTRLPLIVRSPDQTTRGVVSRAMVTWADLTPTILEFTAAKGPDYPLQGRSFLGVLEESDPPDWNEIYASHTFHEVTMYYPMRSIRTRQYRYILNLAHQLPFPFASDLYDSETWQAVLADEQATMYGSRTLSALIHRPRHELYELEADPQEVVNLAEDPAHEAVLKDLETRLRAWQERTSDPWLIKYQHE